MGGTEELGRWQRKARMEERGVTQSFFGQDQFSDVPLHCGEMVVHCHKVVLCQAFAVFRDILARGNATTQQPEDVHLLEDKNSVTAMLCFMYGLDYARDQTEWHDGGKFTPHFRVYTTTVKYKVPGLEEAASEHIEDILTSATTTTATDLSDAIGHAAGLRGRNEELRELFVSYCARHLSSFKDDDQVQDRLRDHAPEGVEILMLALDMH